MTATAVPALTDAFCPAPASAPASAAAVDRVAVSRFFHRVRSDPALRSRLRRCSGVRELAAVPEIHRLRLELGNGLASVAGAARVAAFLVEAEKDGPAATSDMPAENLVGLWIATCWKVHRRDRPDDDWRRSCAARLDAILRCHDPDLLLRLLRGVLARSEGRAPLAAVADALVMWETLDRRRAAAERIARGYARATL